MTTFIWPTNTKRVTSKFRTASRPNHNGVDIADPGARPIYAVADGKVTRSYVSTSYGEVVFIEHSIGGQTWETVYAHLRSGSRGYGVGKYVNQGSQIGIMGNTGRSSGQHLHFELHKGNWNINKTDAVDPLKYLEKNLYPSQSSSKWTKVTGNWTGQTLKNGDYGEPVRQLQNKLANNNPPFYPEKGAKNNGVDSYYGDKTGNAVGRYQEYYGLTVDELAGKQVYKSLSGKPISQMAQEVIDGKHGNGHDHRRKSLGISKSEYDKVRKEVNRRL